MQLRAERQYVVEVTGCPRCKGDHTRDEDGRGALLFKPLANPQDRNDLWDLCRETNEPILISSEDI